MPDLSTRTGWRDPSAPERDSRTRSWPRAGSQALHRIAVIYGLWLAVAAACWPSSLALASIWTSPHEEPYSHGFLVLLTSLWLVFRNRARLAAAPVAPAAGARILLVALSALWVWSWRAAIQDAHLLLVPAILLAAIASALGWRTARLLLFPVGFLYFAMPVWSGLHPLLQSLSAHAVGALIWVTGLPAYMQGDLVQLPAGTLRIAEGCSGLHYLIVGLALGALYGELCEDPPRRRLIWLASMGAIALIANWVRIFVVAAVAYESAMRSSLVHHHYWFGWGLFAATFAAFLWIAEGLASKWDRSREADMVSRGTDTAGPARAVSPLSVVLTLACLAALPALSYSMDLARHGSQAVIAIQWPAAPPGWRGPKPVNEGEWMPAFEDAGAESFQRYVNAAGPPSVEVFSAAYRVQRQSAKLLGYRNSLLGDRTPLRSLSARVVTTPVGRWREQVVADPGGTRSVIWSQYRIGNRRFVDPRLSQLWYGIAASTGEPLSSVTALRAVCRPTCRSAEQRLEAAASGLTPALRLESPTGGGAAP